MATDGRGATAVNVLYHAIGITASAAIGFTVALVTVGIPLGIEWSATPFVAAGCLFGGVVGWLGTEAVRRRREARRGGRR